MSAPLPIPVQCFPAGTTVTPASAISACVAGTIPITLIGIMLSFTVVFLAYVIGNVINLESFKNWYRGELWETLKSVILVLVIFSVLAIVGTTVLSVTGPPATLPAGCPSSTGTAPSLAALYNSDMAYICNAYSLATSSYTAFKWFSVGRSIIAQSKRSYWGDTDLIFIGIPVAFQHGYQDTSYLYSNILEQFSGRTATFASGGFTAVTVSMLVLGSEQYMFLSFVLLGFALFLPMGIIMRAMPFIRPLGSLMIGVAIGISVIFPALIVLFNAPIYSYLSNTLSLPTVTSLPPNPITIAPSCGDEGESSLASLGGVASFFAPYAGFLSAYIGTDCSIYIGTNSGAVKTVLVAIQYGLGVTVSPAGVVTCNTGITGIYGGLCATQNGVLEYVSLQTGMDGVFGIYPALNFLFYYVLADVLQLILLLLDIIITITMINNISAWLGGRALRTSVGSIKLI